MDVGRRCNLSYYDSSQEEWYDDLAYHSAPMGYYGLPYYYDEECLGEELEIEDEYLVIEW
jgi:hypothetical protein